MYVLILATVALIINWIIEYFRHRRNVFKIPIRIHVNGTRGKSSVTRLIAAGLRAGGISTVAKTTGTLPRVLYPDGKEAEIKRLAGANIIEQKYIFRHAASLAPQAIVMECMAVNPVYQWLTERMFVRSTVSVITNARPDHLDLMGDTVESVTMCLTNTIPENGYCFTAEEPMFPIMKKVAEKRGSKIFKIRPEGETKVTAEELRNFSYIEHAENVALALAVCQHHGVKRDIALKGMQQMNPDPGALKKYKVAEKGKELHFYNVFAANDPASSEQIMRMVANDINKDAQVIIILNSRSDRYYRSIQLLEIFEHFKDYSYVFLTGERTEPLFATSQNMKLPHIVRLGEPEPAVIYDKAFELTKKESHIIGIGNIAGERKYGAQIVKYFRDKSRQGGTK